MFDNENDFGLSDPIAGPGWSGTPGVVTDGNGTVAGQPWLMRDDGTNGGNPGIGAAVSSVTQQTTGLVGKLIAWPIAHQGLFIGGVGLIALGWFMHHKGMIEG